VKKKKPECKRSDCRYTREMEASHRRNVERLTEALFLSDRIIKELREQMEPMEAELRIYRRMKFSDENYLIHEEAKK
jgi:hypothetical protein